MEAFVELIEKIGWSGALLFFLGVGVYRASMFIANKLFNEEEDEDGIPRGYIPKALSVHVSLVSSLEKGLTVLIKQQEETHSALMTFAITTEKSVDAIRRAIEQQGRIEMRREQRESHVGPSQPPSGIMVEVVSQVVDPKKSNVETGHVLDES